MDLLRPNEIPRGEPRAVFSYSRARALAGVALGLVAASSLLIVAVQRQAVLAYYLAAVIVAALAFARRSILARFRFSNWLVRLTEEGLYVQLRSYLNYHFSESDRTVAFIPYREIRSVREVRERREVPALDSRTGRHTDTQRRRLVELELIGDSTKLAQALTDEVARPAPVEKKWYGSTGTKYNHYPVVLESPARLVIEWRVTPASESFINSLRGHVAVEPTLERPRDYSRLDTLDREEQERRLRELVASGRTMEAIKIARALYACDLDRARELVNELGPKQRASRPRSA